MKPIFVQQLAEILGASITAGRGDVLISSGVSTDTRTISQGSAFFALCGENFDGDAFAVQALEKGAAVAVVRKWVGEYPANTAVIVVQDPLLALQRLASWWRNQLEIPVVAITGSNGKTSTKDFTAAVLSKKFQVSATRGNLNNHIGVPLTILATTLEHRAAVWEMGMNHPGEIAPLGEMAQPQYGIITNIGSAHIEFFGTREGIAEEKGMLARALPPDGTLFLPANDEFHDYLRQQTRASCIDVGGKRSPVRAENLRLEVAGASFRLVIDGAEPVEVSLPVPGRHMVVNALLAAAVGWKLGLSPLEIADALSNAILTDGRLGCYDYCGITIIDDTYNANPESMAAAIETLLDSPVVDGSRRVIVLGRMGELGDHAAKAHLHVGALAAQQNLTVVAVGEGAEGIAEGAGHATYFSDSDEAAKWLAREVKPGDVVLFKGSRSAKIERVMNAAFPQN
ncbi:MAG: UDP-N-acetylmuramoyl-tripeptide--D-alanyl-D-alanine ligase [Akkermansiaceae bacterium]|nr:UDP-N-acetylmuramoyl-tripeptide--D-alanyl-D-alanine ligase [Akkermansiaceae bacterium]